MKSKEVKRAEALERQAKWDSLPRDLKELKVRLTPGNSTRQRRRMGMSVAPEPDWDELYTD